MNKTPEKQPDARELRTFGLLVGAVFGLIAVYPLFKGETIRAWSAVISAALIAPAIFFPPLLALPHRIWSMIGHILGWLNTRIILTLLYFAAIVPVSLVLKILGRDPLKLSFDPELDTYREKPEKQGGSDIRRQF
jgi:hypothetical protein